MHEKLGEIIDATREMVPDAVALAGMFRAESGGGLKLHEVLLLDGSLLSEQNPELFDLLDDEIDAALSWLTDGAVRDSDGGDAIIYMDGTSEPWNEEAHQYLETGRRKLVQS